MEVLKKKEKLQELSKFLKSKYHGIDKPIDEIIEAIEIWYIYSDVLYIPFKINLWGMTGVGKTSVVRDIVKFLNFYEDFREVDLSRGLSGKDSYSNSNMNDWSPGDGLDIILSSICPKYKEKGVLLLDEIHKMDRNKFPDFWPLLSDGRISSVPGDVYEVKRLLSEVEGDESKKEQFKNVNGPFPFHKNLTDTQIDNIYKLLQSNEKPQQTPPHLQMGTPYPHFQDRFDTRIGSEIGRESLVYPITINEWKLKTFIKYLDIKSIDDLDPFFNFLIINRDVLGGRIYPDNLKQMMSYKLENKEMSILDILNTRDFIYMKPFQTMCNNYIEERNKVYNSVEDGRDPLVFDNLLIFNCANLDDLFHKDKVVKNEDDIHELVLEKEKTPDELYEYTSNLSVEELKEVLLKRFQREEVGRFGSVHIIFPSIKGDAFKKIIRDKLKLVEKDFFKSTGIGLDLNSKKLIEEIYEGTIASQGARPVISKTYQKMSSILPYIVKYCYKNNITKTSYKDMVNKKVI